jgi:trypsin
VFTSSFRNLTLNICQTFNFDVIHFTNEWNVIKTKHNGHLLFTVLIILFMTEVSQFNFKYFDSLSSIMTHSTPSIVFLIFIFTINLSYQLDPKIVNGFNITSINGFEYQVSLRGAVRDKESFGSGHICGGSLIDYGLVLTAAHCVHDGEKYFNSELFTVVMGNILRFGRDNNTVVSSVKEIIGHENYDPDTFENDIALIYLSQNISENHPTIKPISLSNTSPPVGESCIITGWGAKEFQFYQDSNEDVSLDTNLPNILMGTKVIINSKSDCNHPQSYDGEVLVGMFCAGSFTGPNITDSCKGDSG